MKVAAILLSVLILASCKNQVESNQSITATNTASNYEASGAFFAKLGFTERIIDFGKLVPFKNNQIIYFTNEGDTNLIIDEVYAGSDRIEIHGFTYELAPGEQGKIRLRVSDKLDHLKYQDSIFIKSNSNNTTSLAKLDIEYEISDDLVIGGNFVEDRDRINVRMFPALDATVMFGLNKGDSVRCIGVMQKDYVEDFETDIWYYIDYKGRKGWVLSALTDFTASEVVALK